MLILGLKPHMGYIEPSSLPLDIELVTALSITETYTCHLCSEACAFVIYESLELLYPLLSLIILIIFKKVVLL